MSGAAPKAPAYWYDGTPVPLPMRALAGAYGRAVAVRRGLYARGVLRATRVAAPVVVVGNLVAGGSGKTPLVLALVERLQRAGWTPGVASRGYGRRHAGTPAWVEAGTDPALGGDEPVLIAQRSGCPVRVDADRVAAARALVAAGCNVVVCDDGLQHYALARDIEIEVIDGARGYGNGQLIPAGPLREPPSRSAQCDFRVVNRGAVGADDGGIGHGGDAAVAAGIFDEPGFGQWPMRVVAAQAVPMRGVRPVDLASFAGTRVHAVAGLGDPERFFAMLRALDIAVVPHAFADHHAYVADDLQFGSDLPVLATEKDAVKILALGSAVTLGNRWYRVPIEAQLPEAFWIALLARLQPLRRVAP